MRHLIRVGALLAILIVAAPASAAIDYRTTYECDPTDSLYTACAEINNEIQTWIAPGRLGKTQPLVVAAAQQTNGTFVVQRSIAAGDRGAALTGFRAGADGAVIYSYRQMAGAQNFQALIGFRLSSGAWPEGCIISSYLDCEMGPQLEWGRDSKHEYTITSRPFEVRILNGMQQDLKRVDGPYWSNALWNPAIDSAARIAPSGTGTVGSLRSVVKDSAYAAVYKFQRSETDTRFNGDSVLISVRANSDGTHTGKCTPIFPPSGARFTCSVAFSGSGTGHLTATVRVQTA
ncbi:MAG: hypothetical protein WCN97_11380 [Thermoleophilia bacterium]